MARSVLAGGDRAGSGWVAALRCAAGVLAALTVAMVCTPTALAKPPGKAPPAKYLKEDRGLVDDYAAVEGAKLGVVLPGGPESFIDVVDSTKYSLTVHSYGKTYQAGAVTDLAWNSSGSEAIGARITVYGISHSAHGSLIRGVIAHEVFHVFEARMSGTEARSDGHAGWLEEGAASWVESDLVSNDPAARQEWEEYLEAPKRPLFTRVYSAIGFFAHMSSSHISPWTHFKAMFEAEGDAASYAAAGVDQSFLNSEASVFFREPSFGTAWEQQGQESADANSNVPSRAQVTAAPAKVKVTGKESVLAVAPYAHGIYDLQLKNMPASKPVLELLLSRGNARMHSVGNDEVDEVIDGSLRVCSSSHGCDCPGGPASDYPRMREGDLAITGGSTAGQMRLIPLPRCETLLGATSCEHLLPGFSNEPEKVAGAAAGVHFAIEGGDHALGEYTYVCLFQEKGQLEGPETEQYFHGVIAVSSSVSRFPVETDATRQMQTYTTFPSPTGPVAYVPVSGAGEDGRLASYGQTANSRGEPECASEGVVRVHNVVATFGLAGDEEACGVPAENLLRAIASEL
ncbi:MAG: hypothetical protein ABSG93_07155 [Solirubrobacteraceae bacterium]